MKKIFISILVLTTLCVTFGLSAAEGKTDYTYEINLIKNIGIMQGYEDGSLKPENEITRMEFAAVVVRTFGYDDIANGYENNSYFPDVTQDMWGAKYINLSKQFGWIDGYSNGVFSPYDKITVNQAIKIFVCALGYRNIAEAQGYPDGYIAVLLKEAKLSKVGFSEKPATRGEIACIIKSILDVKIADTTYVGSEGEKYSKTDDTILDILGLETRYGFVEAVNGISIGSNIELKDDEAVVDGVVYKISCGKITDFVGSNVKMYVKNDKSLNFPCIVNVENSGNNEEITVYAKDIQSSTTLKRFSYYSNETKKKYNISLNSYPVIIYNGKLLTTAEMKDDKLKPETGSVTIKNPHSEKQTIFVWEYENLVVRSVSDKKIYDLFGKKVDLSEDVQCEIYLNGVEIEISDLMSGDVLNVATSSDGEFVRIVVSRDKIEGTINAVSEEDFTSYHIGVADDYEEEVFLAKNYVDAIASNSSKIVELYPGDNGIFYLDYFGDIAYSESLSDDNELCYGYITEAYVSRGIGNTVEIQIMNQNNSFDEFEISSKSPVKYGIYINGKYVVQKKQFDKFLDAILEDDKVLYQIVKYKIGNDGNLREIYLHDGGNDVSEEWGEFVSATNNFAYYNGTIDGRYLIDANTIAFYIPNAGLEKNLFKAGKAVTMLSSNNYDVQLYDIREGRVGLVVIKTQVPADNGYTYMIDMVNNPVMLIENVIYKSDEDGEFHKYIVGWQDGKLETVEVSDSLEANSDDDSNLYPGMLIQYLLNTEEISRAETSSENEKIILFKTIENLNTYPAMYQKWNYLPTKNTNAKISVISGTVLSYNYPNMVVDCGEETAGVSVNERVNVISWNRELRTGKVVSVDDVMLNENVIIRTRYNTTKDIFIFE